MPPTQPSKPERSAPRELVAQAPPGLGPDAEWQFRDASRNAVSFAELRRLATSGAVRPDDDIYCREFSPGWVKAADVPGLFAAAVAAGPPPIPVTSSGPPDRPRTDDLPPTGLGQAFRGSLFGPTVFRLVGRIFGVVGVFLLLASFALVWFGWSWIGLAIQCLVAFFVGEGVSTLLEQSRRSASQSGD